MPTPRTPISPLALLLVAATLLGQPLWAQEAAEAPVEAAETPVTDEPAAEEEAEPSVPATAPPADTPMPPVAGADPDNPGQASLDRALELKLDAQDLKDLGEVVDLIDEALAEGLDVENTEFAEQVLVATLMQRGTSLASAVLGQPITDPRRDPRWLQVRQFALTDLQRAVSLDEAQHDAWLLIGRLQSLPMGSQSEARRGLTKVIQFAEAAADDPELDAPDDETLAQAYALRGAAQKSPKAQMDDFARAIELQPEKAEYLMLRAQAHRVAGDTDACLDDIDRAIEINPENPKVHELKALALLMQEKQDEALESFDRASELAPKLLTPYQYRGELYSQLGQTEQAIEQLDKALELSPNNLASLLIRAQLLFNDEQFERSLADIDLILKQQPGLVQAHRMKAQTLDKLGRTDDAIAWLERLVSVDPNRPELQMQLAVFYVDKSMAPEAVEVLTKILELDESNELARRLRGDMHLFAGDHEAAVADFDLALEQNPLDSGVLNNYAWTLATSPYESVRDGDKAVELATKACEVTEYSAPHILSTLAAANAEKGDFDEAVRRSEEAIAKATELDTLDGYDGQLEAELVSYRAGQPWRELQRLDIAGPADQAAGKIAEMDEKDQPADPETPATDAPPATADAPLEEAPARSFDF